MRLRKGVLDNPVLNIAFCRLMYLFPPQKRNAKSYKKLFYKNLDYQNTDTFAAELIKRMSGSAYRDRLYQYADKYLVREYVSSAAGKDLLVPLIGVYDKVSDIPWDKLSDGVIIKANNGSRFNIVYDSSGNKLYYKWLLNRWLRLDYSFFAGEMQYSRIVPKILIEKNIALGYSLLEEYSCYAFGGKTEFVYYYNSNKEKTELTRSMEKTEFSFNRHSGNTSVNKDDFFRVIDYADMLAEPFGFVRVDFMVSGHRIYFCELTFSPRAGMAAFSPDRYNSIFCEKLKATDIINKKITADELRKNGD